MLVLRMAVVGDGMGGRMDGLGGDVNWMTMDATSGMMMDVTSGMTGGWWGRRVTNGSNFIWKVVGSGLGSW